MSCCYCCMRFFVCLFVFSSLWFGRSCRFLCAGKAIILSFQHYFTMLGTTVLIPSLVILNINGHSICSYGETLTDRHRKERFRKILIFFLYFLCHEMHVKKFFFAITLLWFVLCGHCGKIVCCCCCCCCCCVSMFVLFVVEWLSTSCAELAFCFWDQYFVADCTGFKIADSHGKLLLFSADHTFHRQCSSYHRHSWPAWGNRSSTSYSSTHSQNLWLEEFSIQLVFLRSLSFSVSVPFKHY